MTHTSLDITGMTCAACATRVTRVLAKQPGVSDAQVNLALERAEVTHDASVDVQALIERVAKAGYGASKRDTAAAARKRQDEERAARKRSEYRKLAVRFVLSAALSLPLLVAMLPMMTGLGGALMPGWMQAILATGVMITAGTGFWREAIMAVRGGSANMAVLVSLGTTTAWAWSMWQVVSGHGHGHLYFEAAAIVLTLVLLGKLLETRAKAGASNALMALEKLQPDTAEKVDSDGTVRTVPLAEVNPGDTLRVRPGSRVPADGEIIDGRSSLDESLVTGESRPVVRQQGDRVLTGTVNGEAPITIRVSAIGENTRLAGIARLVEDAQLSEAPIQRLVDRISAVFVPVIILIAAATFLGWWLVAGSIETALVNAVSVLVIACPCALGLATPTALVAGTGAAARAGILIRDIETLEKASAIRTIAFDKTGTLTRGEPELERIETFGEFGEAEILGAAAAVEATGNHPLASAVVTALEARGGTLEKASNTVTVGGRGLQADVSGRRVAVGNDAFMADLGLRVPAGRERSGTLSYVAIGDAIAGALHFTDALRPETPDAIVALRNKGLAPVMLTGDNMEAARRIAATAGIDQIEAGLSPEEKLDHIRRLAKGGDIAFAGDGMNDAPALAAANLGIALAGGTDVAREAAAVTLMRPDLRLVPASLDIAARTRSTIRQNLVWAFIYNVIGIPLAAFGVLSPVFAGAAMAFSSVSVVTNSLRLTRWKPWFDKSA